MDGTAVTVGVGGALSAVNATWDTTVGATVTVNAGGSAELGTVVKLLSSSAWAGATLTINTSGTVTLDTGATLILGASALLTGADTLTAGATTITGGADNG
jgi:hypothetical protein